MVDLYDDIDTVLEIAEKQDQVKGRAENQGKPHQIDKNRVRLINNMCREVIHENLAKNLTPQEEEFANAVISGASLADAYEQAFPEACWATEYVMKQGEIAKDSNGDEITKRVPLLNHHQKFYRGNKLSKSPGVRSRIILGLDQEGEEASHTAKRLDNLIIKALEAEATNPSNSAAARISAIDKLSKHRVVQVAEQSAAERAAQDMAPEEVMDGIKRRIRELKGS